MHHPIQLAAQRRALLRIVIATALTTLVAAIVALSVALDASAARDARAGTTAAAPDVVFTRHVRGTGRADVYGVAADGSGLRRLTRDGMSGDASHSPDGRHVVFSSGRAYGPHAPELYVMRADGTNVQRLTESVHGPRGFWRNTQPAWSPDGRTIVFVRTLVRGTRETTDLWRLGVGQRGRPSRITTHPGREANPAFTPDGVLGFDRDGRIHRLSPLGLGTVRPGTDPAWSPDRTYLAFVGATGVELTLGQSARTVAAGAAAPSWSPDGRQLVYATGGGLEVLEVLVLHGRRLTRPPAGMEDLAPSWRPTAAAAQSTSIASPNE